MSILWATASGAIVLPPTGSPAMPIGYTSFERDDTDTPTYAEVVAAPNLYVYQGGSVLATPNLTLASTEASGVTTLTATLASAPKTPPGDVAFALAGGSASVALASGAASLDVQLHPSIAGGSVPCSVGAIGCVGASIDLGTPGTTQALTLVAPGAPGNPSTTAYLVAPTTRVQLRAYYLGLDAETQVQVLTQALQNMYLADSILLHFVLSRLLPQATASAWAALTLSADEQHALTDMQASLLPNFGMVLGTVYPAGGTRVPQYAETLSQAPTVNLAAQEYAQAVASLPWLT